MTQENREFSFPEITVMLNESDYIRAVDMITSAAGLVGDGGGGDLDYNPEYTRGMAEVILRTMGWEVDHVSEVIACIKATAKDTPA